jgi:iron complex transport system substrate-binding protein
MNFMSSIKCKYILICLITLYGTLFSQLEIKYAKKFKLEQQGQAWILTINGPYKGSLETIRTRLSPKGYSLNSENNFNGNIEVPLDSVISLSTVNLPHLVALDEHHSLVGVDSLNYINTPEVTKMIAANQLVAVGDSQKLDIEKVLELNPDLVLTYTTGQSKYDTHQRLEKAGVPTLLLASYLESSPLGRAEWIKVFGVLYGKIDLANQLFSDIEQRYLNLCQLTTKLKSRPSVLCNAPFGNTWYVPGGNSFMAKVLADAGANYLWKDHPETGGVPLAFEAVFEKAHQADIWLVSSHLPWKSYQDVLKSDPRYQHLKAFQTKKMYSNDKRVNKNGGNDIFEKGTLHPDLILNDLIKIFHPDLLPESEFYFYRHLQ